MFGFFRQAAKRMETHRSFKLALNLAKQGKKREAFDEFDKLSKSHPFDVNVRRQLVLLGNELHKEVTLPSLNNVNP